jgi:hypothetical protein
MCVKCKDITKTPVPVRDVDPGTGPVITLYACPGCAPGYLTPDTAWSLAIQHAAACGGCSSGGLCATGTALDEVHRGTARRGA